MCVDCHEVLDADPDAILEIDARLDAEGMTGRDRKVVALDHVGVLVLLHADAVARAVDEVLAVAGVGDDGARILEGAFWVEIFDDPRSAIEREKKLKQWRRDWKLALIEEANPDWRDLYDEVAV